MFEDGICKKAILEGNYEWRKHTIQRMAQRNVGQDEVIEVLLQGIIIAKYDVDKPYPSALFMKIVNQRPLHVVVAIDAASIYAYIITVYEPSLDVFESDFITKKKSI